MNEQRSSSWRIIIYLWPVLFSILPNSIAVCTGCADAADVTCVCFRRFIAINLPIQRNLQAILKRHICGIHENEINQNKGKIASACLSSVHFSHVLSHQRNCILNMYARIFAFICAVYRYIASEPADNCGYFIRTRTLSSAEPNSCQSRLRTFNRTN